MVHSGSILLQHRDETEDSQSHESFNLTSTTTTDHRLRKQQSKSQKDSRADEKQTKLSKGQLFTFGTLLTLFVILVCVFFFWRRNIARKRRDEQRRRQQIRAAVRAKIAEMEGIKEVDSMRWYTEQRNSIVRFGDVVEIDPSESQPSLRVLYHPIDSRDLSELKQFELRFEHVFGTMPLSTKASTSSMRLSGLTRFLHDDPGDGVDEAGYGVVGRNGSQEIEEGVLASRSLSGSLTEAPRRKSGVLGRCCQCLGDCCCCCCRRKLKDKGRQERRCQCPKKKEDEKPSDPATVTDDVERGEQQ